MSLEKVVAEIKKEIDCTLLPAGELLRIIFGGQLFLLLFNPSVDCCLNADAQGKYAEALDLSARINMPGFFHAHAVRAAALGQLGQCKAAHSALQELLALRPDFAITVRRDYTKWWDSKRVEHLIDGLRKAGLEIADEPSSPSAKPATRA